MLEYSVCQSNDDIIITILEGDYKSVAAKIVNLQFDSSGSPSFELELPKTRTELFEDEVFIKEVQLIVGDILKKSVDYIWDSQLELSEINEKMDKLLIDKKINVDKKLTEIERFMKNGYLLKLDETKENIIAVDMNDSKEYNLSNDKDFDYIKSKIYPTIILN